MLPVASLSRTNLIACEICLKEIPHDLAISQEGVEYVQYFCGIECYSKWDAEQSDLPEGNADNN